MKTIHKEKLRIILFFVTIAGIILGYGLPSKTPLVERPGKIRPFCMIGYQKVEDLSVQMRQKRPELILLGNSMLGAGVDQQLLNEELSRRAMVVWLGGASSAWWYLAIKNVIVPSPAKPKHLVILFRDNFLTLPRYRVDGKYKDYIINYAVKDEQVLDKILYFSNSSYYSLLLKSYIPFIKNADLVNERIKNGIKNKAAKFTGIGTLEDLDKAIDIYFNEKRFSSRFAHLAQIQEDKLLEDKMDYTFRPEKTFLPHIVSICKQNGIDLTLVRVKRLRDTQKGRQPQGLLEYTERLKVYLAEKGIQFIDYSDNTELKPYHYGKGDHLNAEEGRPLFTSILSEDLKQIFSRPSVTIQGADT